MRPEYLATSFFTCGENSSQDYYKIGEAADNGKPVPDSVTVWEPFEDYSAEELMDEIGKLKMLLDKVKGETAERYRVRPSEDYLEVHFEVSRVLTMNADYYIDQIEKSDQPEKGTGGLWVLAKRITDKYIKEFDEGVIVWHTFLENTTELVRDFKI